MIFIKVQHYSIYVFPIVSAVILTWLFWKKRNKPLWFNKVIAGYLSFSVFFYCCFMANSFCSCYQNLFSPEVLGREPIISVKIFKAIGFLYEINELLSYVFWIAICLGLWKLIMLTTRNSAEVKKGVFWATVVVVAIGTILSLSILVWFVALYAPVPALALSRNQFLTIAGEISS